MSISLPIHLRTSPLLMERLSVSSSVEGAEALLCAKTGWSVECGSVLCTLGWTLGCLHALSQFRFTRPRRSDYSSFLEWAFCSARRYVGLADAACVMGASPAFRACLPSS